MIGKWKRAICLLIISMIWLNIPQKIEASVSVSASSAILIEQNSGRILYEKDAFTKRRIASITKIMTAILAIESGKLNETVKVSERASRAEGSSVFLKPGEKIKLEDLVYGLMLRSGNDAAVAIAEHVGGSIEGFVYLMNKKAEEIGMSNTHFANPHGLDDHEDHYSTAYDMALLTRYAMMNKKYREISGTKVYRAPNPDESWDRIWRNKNRLLTEMYEYCTGGKTGYTKRAKRTLVSTAEKDGMNLIAVTLNGPDDWNDHIHMYEMAFNNYKMAEILPKGMVKAVKNSFYKNHLYLNHPFLFPLTDQEKDKLRVEYKLIKPKKKWEKECGVSNIVGKAIVYLDEKMLASQPIYYRNSETNDESFFDFFRNIFTLVIGVKSNG
ncbi:D-alanyl-D-alanine carboxypeptidase family protein [Bacillus methanolicus]|uniref:serine-type D-Ala-D-Ala carboxypeptidase n=1 Tax=Bacillus methanolicus (strain MGA3 / ATCC 53907) TaxID=796606 RepID=I3EA35_BACMM|nr:D-alanyl-D-alanine carboxypeptidase family protein [Bacillus methanolicus]AIE60598.1 D-alanyl-D-alanine carboxypeptidase DacB [Bacillus methanolicus MGA3]EIJ83356.1 D-alanyl-D-alanine carboxypeptidase [Bacillus methanolicus MGA3]